MDYRYCILNECLVMVRQCNSPTNSKLSVETLLYKMKMLLLTGSERCDVDSSLCNVKDFEELLRQIHIVCEGKYQQNSWTDLTDRIQYMLTFLNSDSAPL